MLTRFYFVFLSLFIITSIFLWGCKKADNNPEPADPLLGDSELPYTREDWMSNVDDGITLGQMTIPGTHDSGADLHTSQVNSIASPYVICQDFHMTNQLKLGVRWFDIRLRYVDDGDLAVHHGDYYLHKNFSDVLNWSLEFLSDHPSEVVILMIKQENSSASAHDFGWAVYNEILSKGLDHFFLENRVPSLGEARGKIFIVRQFQKPASMDFGIFTDWASNTTGSFTEYGGVGFYVQDHYSLTWVETSTKFYEVQHCIDLATIEAYNHVFHLNFVSGERVEKLETLWTTASQINPLVEGYLELYNPGKKNCGVIMINFAGGGDDDPRNCAPNLVLDILNKNF